MEGRCKMKINGPNDIVNLDKAYSEKRVRKNEQKKEAAKIQQGGKENITGDMVNISSEAGKIQHIKTLIEDIPDIRESRVNVIKEEVDNGKYQTDSDKTARAIIRENIFDHLL